MNLSEVLVSKEERQLRLLICRACPHYKRGLLGWLGISRFARCGVCHCFLQVKAKLKGLGCPIDKW